MNGGIGTSRWQCSFEFLEMSKRPTGALTDRSRGLPSCGDNTGIEHKSCRLLLLHHFSSLLRVPLQKIRAAQILATIGLSITAY